MGLPQQTSTNPIEKPSTSETTISKDQPSSSTPAAEISNTAGSVGGTTDPSRVAGGAMGGSHGSAEEAADRLYEERIEEEYAKREGGA